MLQAECSYANYRIHGARYIQRLAFICHCRSLDMTLGKIRTYFRDAPQENCAEVNGLFDENIGHVADRIRELKSLEKELNALREHCVSSQTATDCEVLSGLENASQTSQCATRQINVTAVTSAAHICKLVFDEQHKTLRKADFSNIKMS